MKVSIDFSSEDLTLIEEQAAFLSITPEEFILRESGKAARNAAYLRKLDIARKNLEDGKGKYVSNEQLEALVNGNAV